MKFLSILIAGLLLVTGCATQMKAPDKRYDANVSIVKFNFDKSDLANNLQGVLKEAKVALDEYIHKNDHMYGRDGYKVGVVGHTDYVATEEYNDKLGMRRANAVAAYLKLKGVDVFLVYSAGETDDVVIKPYRAENFHGVEYAETNRGVTLITLH